MRSVASAASHRKPVRACRAASPVRSTLSLIADLRRRLESRQAAQRVIGAGRMPARGRRGRHPDAGGPCPEPTRRQESTMAEAEEWVSVARADEVPPGSAKAVWVQARGVALVNLDGRFY